MDKLFQLKFGSFLYGSNTPSSDLDLKSVYIPSSREIVLGNYKKTICTSRPKSTFERNNKDDIDIEIISLDKYLKQLSEGQTYALDILFAAPEEMFIEKGQKFHIFEEIRKNKDLLITKNCLSIISYARTQAAKYGVKGSRMDALKQTLDLLKTFHLYTKLGDHEEHLFKLVEDNKHIISLEKEQLIQIKDLPTGDKITMLKHLEICNRKLPWTCTVKFAIEVLQKIFDGYGNRAHKAHLDGGKDYKALSHAVRVNAEGLELLTTGHITFPRPEAKLLVDIKNRSIPFEEISVLIEEGLNKLVEASKVSTLRDKTDQEWIDNFVCDVYTKQVKGVL